MKVLNEKYILKRAVRGLIPENVRLRKKQPYRAPDAASFFTNGSLIGYAAEQLSTARLQQTGLFNPAAVQKLVAKADQGELGTKDNMGIVGILSTQLLVDRFIGVSTYEQARGNTPVRRRELLVRAGR